VVGITAFVAARFCAFWGRRLPSFAEWTLASRTHPQRTLEKVEGCRANLDGVDDGADILAPVGSCAGDVTEEGVVDLLGNVSEWLSHDESAGLRNYAGSNWSYPADAPPGKLDYLNSAAPSAANFGIGVRCASE
jgi:formylglycine-generating enzyme required for sulfatase activity